MGVSASPEEHVIEIHVRMPRLAVLELLQFDFDGHAVARRIYARFAVPIILIVDACSNESVKLAAEFGVCAMLTKPIKGHELLAAPGFSLAAACRV